MIDNRNRRDPDRGWEGSYKDYINCGEAAAEAERQRQCDAAAAEAEEEMGILKFANKVNKYLKSDALVSQFMWVIAAGYKMGYTAKHVAWNIGIQK